MTVSFETLRGWYTTSRTATESWRQENRELNDFVAGHQWDEADKAVLKESQRYPIVYNRAEVIIDAVSGSEVNNRHETTYEAVEVGDAGVSELLTSVVRWARHRCQADSEESDAFRDMIISGIGCTRTGPDYDGDRPEVVIERVDMDEIVWDHTAKKRNLTDRRYNFRARRIDRITAQEVWPNREPEELHAQWASDTAYPGNAKLSSGFPGRAYETGGGGAPNEHITRREIVIVEAEWWERESQTEILSESPDRPGQMESAVVGADKLKDAEDRLIMAQRLYTKRPAGKRKVYYRAILGKDDIIERYKMDPQRGGFRYKFMTAKREKTDNGYIWYGLARPMRDPQKWANKFLQQVLHIINSGALGRVIFEENAFQDPRRAQKDWSKPNAWIQATRGSLMEKRIEESQPPPIPAAIVEMMSFAIGSIRECAGVNPELLGQTDRQQAGVLEYQRRQAGMNVLAVLFDSLTQYREEQGYLMLHMVLTHLNDGRVVRIVGERGAQYVPFVHQDDATEYDVQVSEAPSAPDQKERTWQHIQSIVPQLLQAQIPEEIWAEIVRYSPLPSPLADKIAKFLEEKSAQSGQPSPEQEMAMQAGQLQLQKLQSEVEENQAQAELDRAKADEIEGRLGVEKSKVALTALDQAKQTALAMKEPGAAAQQEMERDRERETAERQQAGEQESFIRQQVAERETFDRQSKHEREMAKIQTRARQGNSKRTG